MENRENWKRRDNDYPNGDGTFTESVEVRNPKTREWEVESMRVVTWDDDLSEFVPVGERLVDIAARESEEKLQSATKPAFEAAKNHQARIDKGVAAMSDVEYAMFSQLDDIKVLLGGVRSNSKFAESIRLTPQFGMGIYLIDSIEDATEDTRN
jgi:hypothetical protein